MQITSNNFDAAKTGAAHHLSSLSTSSDGAAGLENKKEVTRDVFQDFVGQTFFSQMIASLRSTQEPSAYFHGGRAEEVFQGQFDQMLSEELSDASADKIADPMFELFMLGRQA